MSDNNRLNNSHDQHHKYTSSSVNEIKPSFAPLDLTCLFIESQGALRKSLIKILKKARIKFISSSVNSYCLNCEKEGIKFEIDLAKNSKVDGTLVVSKKKEGGIFMYKELLSGILVSLHNKMS